MDESGARKPGVIGFAASVDHGDGFAGLAQKLEHAPADFAQPAQDEMLLHAASGAYRVLLFRFKRVHGIEANFPAPRRQIMPDRLEMGKQPVFQIVRAGAFGIRKVLRFARVVF